MKKLKIHALLILFFYAQLSANPAIDAYHLNSRLNNQRSLIDAFDPRTKPKSLSTHINAFEGAVIEEPELEQAHKSLKNLEENKQAAAHSPHSTKNNDEPEVIEFYFENADMVQFLNQVEQLFGYTFITDDVVDPLPEGKKSLKGNKISFKTNKPLTRPQAWDLFNTFLDIAGFTVVPQADPNHFRIMAIPAAQRAPIPAFIGVDPALLPDSDEIIRYVYFIENSTVDTLKPIIDNLKSTDAPALGLKEHKAFLIIDKAYNVKNLMTIIKELDKVTVPQALSVLKLQRADAQEVKTLYEALIKGDDDKIPQRFLSARKKSTASFFPKGIQIFAEPRTNALILLGPEDAIKKIEDFIINHVDIELGKPYSPLYVYNLQYAQAEVIAEIMKQVTQFGKDTEAGKVGGIRSGDKYFKPITFTPEPDGNRLIIRGSYDDYLKAKEIIAKLDEPQPQVAIEVLLLSVNLSASKELGAQLRSKLPHGIDGLVGDNVKFQTSGLRAGGNPSSIVTKPPIPDDTPFSAGVSRLLGDLISLVAGATAGNTIVSLGRDACGVWGIFQALETVSNAQVIANPFVVATNNTPAKVSVGEVRRVITAVVVGEQATNAFGSERAALTVEVTPQINSDGMIMLDLMIELSNFLPSVDPANVSRATRTVKTQTIVADKEVLALGGLIQTSDEQDLSRVPILGQIPVLGWLFKNKRKSTNKNDLLILISPRIIPAETTGYSNTYTKGRINNYQDLIRYMKQPSDAKDPVYKFFFEDAEKDRASAIDKLVLERHIGQDNYVEEVVEKDNIEMANNYNDEYQEPIKEKRSNKKRSKKQKSKRKKRSRRSPHRKKRPVKNRTPNSKLTPETAIASNNNLSKQVTKTNAPLPDKKADKKLASRQIKETNRYKTRTVPHTSSLVNLIEEPNRKNKVSV